jgi:hypothetical protein
LTILICVVFFVILFEYSHKTTISVRQRRVFNALVTANSIALGVNLTASLRSYAKMIRWRLLATHYRPLNTFELIMGCDSIRNTIKLLFVGRSKEKFFCSVRIYATIWILINLAATVLVGIIGLTYNLDLSPTFVLTTRGNLSITDLSQVLGDDYEQSLLEVNRWGSRGWVYDVINSTDADDEYFGSYGSYWNGSSWYFFDDLNEDGSKDIVSWREVTSEARCTVYEVTQGSDGNSSSVVYTINGKAVNQTIDQSPGPGGLAFITSTNSTCGSRCTNILAFQAEGLQSKTLEQPSSPIDARFFVCTNTISKVYDGDSFADQAYQFPDLQARMIAGAIGWSGNPAQGTHQQVAYLNTSDLSFNSTPTSVDMADLVSRYSIAVVAAGDNSFGGIGRKDVASSSVPIDAQTLNVQWKYAGALLAGIPFLQFLTLMAVIIWANKAIIKDDSPLAIAKVYQSVLEGLGKYGCMLRGEEIARELGHPMVVYGFVPPDETVKVGHIDVFRQDSGVRVKRAFEEGEYDGVGAISEGVRVGGIGKVKLD